MRRVPKDVRCLYSVLIQDDASIATAIFSFVSFPSEANGSTREGD